MPKCLEYTMYSLKELTVESGGGTKSAGVESISQVLYEPGPPIRSDVKIVTTRRVGDPIIKDTVVTYDDDFDISDSSIVIRGVEYPVPTSVTGLEHYDYSYVVDSCTPELAMIRYSPRVRGAPGFAGSILIDRVDSLFVWTDQVLVNAKNLPFIERLRYKQHFDPSNTWFWLPIKEELTGAIHVNMLLGIVTTNADLTLLRSVLAVQQHTDSADCLPDSIDAGQRRVQVSLVPEYAMVLERASQMDTTILQRTSVTSGRRFDRERFDHTGLHIATIGATHLHVLPWLFRSQEKNMGYGALATVKSGGMMVGGGFGLATDEEQKWQLIGQYTVPINAHSLTFGATYSRDIPTLQRSFAAKPRSIERSYLSVAFPDLYEFVGLYDVGVSALYSTPLLSLAYVGSHLDYRLNATRATTFSETTTLDLNSAFQRHQLSATLFGDGIVSPWYDAQRAFSAQATVEYVLPTNDRTTRYWTAQLDLYSTLTLFEFDLGRIRLHSNAQVGWSTDGTPAQFANMIVPQYVFQGDLLSHATLTPNGLYSMEKIATRFELDVDDIPFRALGIPDVEGIRPQLSFVFLGTYLSNVHSVYENAPLPSASIAEVGFRLRSIPLIFTSLMQVDLACYWRISAHGLPSKPFAFTIGISIPL
jgi:hypothetical protein